MESRALTGEVHTHNVKSNHHNCARELMFGKAPLSITEINTKHFDEQEENPGCNKNGQDTEITNKRKHQIERGTATRPKNFPNSQSEKSPKAKVRKVPNIDTEPNANNVNGTKQRASCADVDKTSPTCTLSKNQDNPFPKLSQDRQDVDCGPISTPSVPGNFHNTVNSSTCLQLQADWSLPCFKTIENHNPVSNSALTCEGTKAISRSHKEFHQQKETASESPQSSTEAEPCNTPPKSKECTNSNEVKTVNQYNSAWYQPSKAPLMNNASPVIHTAGQQQANYSAQQQLLHTLQLGGCPGEIMVVPQNDSLNPNSQFILVQQAHLPPHIRMLQPGPEPPNHGAQPMSALAFQHGYPHGMNIPHRQSLRESSVLQLNSSGEEIESLADRSVDRSSPHRAPFPSMLQKQVEQAKHSLGMRMESVSPFFGGSDDNDPGREQHNHKERIRRARIRDACHLLRQLIPGMSDKTDKATVFEFAARYVHFIRAFVGEQYDKDFLIKYSPY